MADTRVQTRVGVEWERGLFDRSTVPSVMMDLNNGRNFCGFFLAPLPARAVRASAVSDSPAVYLCLRQENDVRSARSDASHGNIDQTLNSPATPFSSRHTQNSPAVCMTRFLASQLT